MTNSSANFQESKRARKVEYIWRDKIKWYFITNGHLKKFRLGTSVFNEFKVGNEKKIYINLKAPNIKNIYIA